MQISDIFIKPAQNSPMLSAVRDACSDFIREASGLPLTKSLPKHYSDIHKVKVRKRKKQTGLSEDAFNEAFKQTPHLSRRCVFAKGGWKAANCSDNDTFFIFPTNGFRYLYSPEITESSSEYNQLFNVLFEQFDHTQANKTITDLVKYTYTSHNLTEGIRSGAEIIIYNIPYYYAIREGSCESYDNLLKSLHG